MSNRQLEERQEREFAERVASALDLVPHQLDELEWNIDELTGNDGELHGYTITFQKSDDPVCQEIIDRLTDRMGWVQIGPVL